MRSARTVLIKILDEEPYHLEIEKGARMAKRRADTLLSYAWDGKLQNVTSDINKNCPVFWKPVTYPSGASSACLFSFWLPCSQTQARKCPGTSQSWRSIFMVPFSIEFQAFVAKLWIVMLIFMSWITVGSWSMMLNQGYQRRTTSCQSKPRLNTIQLDIYLGQIEQGELADPSSEWTTLQPQALRLPPAGHLHKHEIPGCQFLSTLEIIVKSEEFLQKVWARIALQIWE